MLHTVACDGLVSLRIWHVLPSRGDELHVFLADCQLAGCLIHNSGSLCPLATAIQQRCVLNAQLTRIWALFVDTRVDLDSIRITAHELVNTPHLKLCIGGVRRLLKIELSNILGNLKQFLTLIGAGRVLTKDCFKLCRCNRALRRRECRCLIKGCYCIIVAELRDSVTSEEEVDAPVIRAQTISLLQVLFGRFDIANLLMHQCACKVRFSTVWLKFLGEGYVCLTGFLPAKQGFEECDAENG